MAKILMVKITIHDGTIYETEILPRNFTAIHQLLYKMKLGVLCWKNHMCENWFAYYVFSSWYDQGQLLSQLKTTTIIILFFFYYKNNACLLKEYWKFRNHNFLNSFYRICKEAHYISISLFSIVFYLNYKCWPCGIFLDYFHFAGSNDYCNWSKFFTY